MTLLVGAWVRPRTLLGAPMVQVECSSCVLHAKQSLGLTSTQHLIIGTTAHSPPPPRVRPPLTWQSIVVGRPLAVLVIPHTMRVHAHVVLLQLVPEGHLERVTNNTTDHWAQHTKVLPGRRTTLQAAAAAGGQGLKTAGALMRCSGEASSGCTGPQA
jgi:hypothetical protein